MTSHNSPDRQHTNTVVITAITTATIALIPCALLAVYNILAAILLGTIGAGLLVATTRLLRATPQISPCAMPSPDDNPCTGTLGHPGWHHADQLEWYGDAWMLPTNTITAAKADPVNGGSLTPFVALAASVGLLLLAGIAVATWPEPRDPHAHCAYRIADAYPTHALCPDSPDNPDGKVGTDWDGRLLRP